MLDLTKQERLTAMLLELGFLAESKIKLTCPTGSGPQPIMVTSSSRFKQIIEGQGIKVYNPR